MADPTHPPRQKPVFAPTSDATTLRGFFGVFRYSRRALELVWSTNRALRGAAGLTLFAGILPAGVAYIGALIVDAVVGAMRSGTGARHVVDLVLLEGLLVVALGGAARHSLCQSLLRAQLGQRVNVMILEKALTLELHALRGLGVLRQADARAPRGLDATAQPGDAHLLPRAERHIAGQLRRAAVALLALGGRRAAAGGLPAFIAEAKFSGDAFRLFRWRSPETRMQIYLETVLAREDHAKEVKLFGLGPRLLERYRDIFRRLYKRGSRLTIRRDAWGFGLGLIGTGALYGAYAWIAVATVAAHHAGPDDDVRACSARGRRRCRPC